MKFASYISLFFIGLKAFGQQAELSGQVMADDGQPLSFATVGLKGLPLGTQADADGRFMFVDLKPGAYIVHASAVGFEKQERTVKLADSEHLAILFEMKQIVNTFDALVVSGTLNPVSRMESAVPVEIYTPKFFSEILPRTYSRLCKM